MRRLGPPCLALAAWCWLHGPAALACPLCKEALFDPEQAVAQGRLLLGYGLSVAVLIGGAGGGCPPTQW